MLMTYYQVVHHPIHGWCVQNATTGELVSKRLSYRKAVLTCEVLNNTY